VTYMRGPRETLSRRFPVTGRAPPAHVVNGTRFPKSGIRTSCDSRQHYADWRLRSTIYVRPEIGTKSIYELKRRDIVEMLDGIEDEHGPVMADRTLAHLRKAFTWHAARDDNFNSPIVKGMARTSPTERKRKRVLDDQEIRDVWKALDTANDLPSCCPAFVRALLLTAQRRTSVAEMRWEAIDGDVWIVPADGSRRAWPALALR
jgi:integrase